MNKMTGKYNYTSNPEWADVTPIPLNDGSADSGIAPLASIAYAQDYLEATSYLRAVMAANEMSERALGLTEVVISMNPAHYTVWIYRARILFALDKNLLEELAWLNKVSLKYLKNYQIWHHRQVLISSTTHFPTLPTEEQDFLMKMFAQDAKNYHVWSYRHWLVRHFKLWDNPRELRDVDALIDADVRNNSAWNHRFVLRFGPRGDGVPDAGMPGGHRAPESAQAQAQAQAPGGQGLGSGRGRADVVDEEVVDAELEYAKRKILVVPENRSPWVYARGVLRAAGRSLVEWKEFAGEFITEVSPEKGGGVEVKSSHAVEWLADVFAGEVEARAHEEAVRMFTLLKDKYDPIRRNYWDYRIRMVTAQPEVSAAA